MIRPLSCFNATVAHHLRWCCFFVTWHQSGRGDATDTSFCLPQGEDGDYQAVGPVAGMERRELNYAALEFIRGRPREGPSGREDDGANYSEIKAK